MIFERSPCDRKAGTSQPVHRVSAQGGLVDWQVQRVMEAIDSSNTSWSIEALAALVGLGPSSFCRRFRTTTGLPPHRWQMLRRVERARQLLCDPKLMLTDIAFACGYASSAHFSTSFGSATGTTPSEFRRLYAAQPRLLETAPADTAVALDPDTPSTEGA